MLTQDQTDVLEAMVIQCRDKELSFKTAREDSLFDNLSNGKLLKAIKDTMKIYRIEG